MALADNSQGKKRFLRLILTVLAAICYITVFALPQWISSSDVRWGLWVSCPMNVTDNTETEECTSITGDDLPWYFIAVQVVSCLALVVCAPQFFVLCDGSYWEQNKRPALLCFVQGVLMGSILGLLLDNYEDDAELWGENDLAPGLCVWLLIFPMLSNVVLFFIHSSYDDHRKAVEAEKKKAAAVAAAAAKRNKIAPAPHTQPKTTTTATTTTTSASRSLPPLSRSTTATSSNTSTTSTTTATSPTTTTAAATHAATSNAPITSTSTNNSAAVDETRRKSRKKRRAKSSHRPAVAEDDASMRSQLYMDTLRSAFVEIAREESQQQQQDSSALRDAAYPLLERLPTYTLPPIRDQSAPGEAPPSYDDVLRGGYQEMPPPPSVAVPVNPFASTQQYQS